ncbi:MAG TPA: outer membrane protein assembly factor BamB [Candidatus Acidoferrales bacterium]|nr:outer membrane protein assembly factor BamB [Candidatus Acidoferrales bacterium]
MNRRVLVIAALSLALAGCGGLRGWSKTAVEPPAPLPTLTSAVSVSTRWTVDVGGKSEERFPYLAPALGGSRIYAASADGQVVAVELNSGNVAWRVKTKSRITAGPFWAVDTLLVGTLDGEVLALTATDGRIRWRRQMSSEVLATPRAEQGIVVVRTLDGRISGLDLNDGSTRWTYETTVPSLTLRGTGAPVLENGFAMIGLDNGKVIALRLSDGRLAWEETVALPTGRSEVERLVDIDGDPAVLAGGLFVATFQGKVAGFDLRSGRRVWDRDTSSFQSIVAGGDEIYEVDDQSRVNALDLQTGAVRWTQEGLLRRNLSAPALSGRHVIVADGDGYVFWIDRGTGQIRGYTRIDRKGISARPLRVGDEMVVVQGRGGRLAAVQFGRD